MSIEWSVRVDRAFTLRDLLGRASMSLAEILGRPSDADLVVTASSELLPAGARVPIEPRRLTELHDPDASRAGSGPVDFHFVAPAVDGGCLFGLAEFIPRNDDPDSGLFAYVTSERTPGSYVLSIAVLIAAADCAGSAVVDEADLFGMGRLVDGERLRDGLRVPQSGISLSRAISEVLANTGLAS